MRPRSSDPTAAHTTSPPSRTEDIAEGLTAFTETASGAGAEVDAPPGAVVMVVEGDHRIVSTAGYADVRSSEPITVRHVHDLASVSKILTTLTLSRLFSEGHATPECTLDRFFGQRAGCYGDVTLDDLLRHRSGFRPWWPLYLTGGEAAHRPAPEDLLQQILDLSPHYPRGTECRYSDLGMQVAGEVISQITSEPYAEAVRHVLLEPLGAYSVTPGTPRPGAPVAAGPLGDGIEREMVDTGAPFPVSPALKSAAQNFPWRDHVLCGEVADGNAFHAFSTPSGHAAGHAGWFSDAAGLLSIGEALCAPQMMGLSDDLATALGLSLEGSAGAGYQQGRGLRAYTLRWRGEDRRFFGHPGFTGTLLAAAPATAGAPAVISVMLTNRVHGQQRLNRERLAPVETLWREAMAQADAICHPDRGEGTR